jgi:hypothetical protein
MKEIKISGRGKELDFSRRREESLQLGFFTL